MYSCLDRKRERDSGINVFILLKMLLLTILNNSLNDLHNAWIFEFLHIKNANLKVYSRIFILSKIILNIFN